MANLQNELTDVKMKLAASQFSEDSLRDDDQKVAFYTGLLTFLMLFSMSNLLKDHVSHCSRYTLTQFEEMLFLMRLRLGIHTQDLAYRFNVSQPSACRIFEKRLDVCYDRHGLLVYWP